MIAQNVILPIVLIMVIGLVLGTIFTIVFRYKRKNAELIHHSIQLLVESNQAITPELLEKISGGSTSAREIDLRKGVISIAFGISIVVFGLIVSGYESNSPINALASIPIILGIAYLGLWKLSPDNRSVS